MPKMTVTIPHNLPRDEALRRLKRLLEQLRAEHADRISAVQEQWEDSTGRFRLTVMGMHVSGTIHVDDSHARLDGSLPFSAVFFRSQIEQTIRQTALRVLGEEKA